MRGQDNWKGAYDYILNQLFPYNYNDPEQFHILKLKIWVLDDTILEEENLVDNDYDNPLNHRLLLENELMFLDRYIRTKDKKISRDEDNFSTLVRERRLAQRDFITEVNPDTGKRYQRWEQDYSARPTTMSNSQFQSLYTEYKKKEANGELASAYEILSKIDDITIDNRKYQSEVSIKLYQPVDVQMESLKNEAIKQKKKEDIHFVREMLRAHEEIIALVKELEPSDPKEVLGLVDSDENSSSSSSDPGTGSSTETNVNKKVTYTGETVICNFPTIRVDVGESKNHPSHKGMIIEQLGEGGYRFHTKASDLITDYPLPASDIGAYVNEVSPFMDGSVEWNFDDWLYAFYFTETIVTTTSTTTTPGAGGSPTSSSDTETEITKYLRPLGIDKDSFSSEKRTRFDELNTRWKNFNELRENQMSLTGTRYQLEAMFNADIPDIKPDLEKIFRDRKEEKENCTRILRDICMFDEFV